MLRLRIVTGAALAIGALAVILRAPPFVFAILLLACAAVGLREWSSLCRFKSRLAKASYVGVCLAAIVAPWAAAAPPAFVLMPACAFWAAAAAFVLSYPSGAALARHRAVLAAAGALVFAGAWHGLMALFFEGQAPGVAQLLARGEPADAVELASPQPGLEELRDGAQPALGSPPAGQWLVVWLIFVACITDTAAYFTGRTCGRHRLAPAVSPAKTWEGFAGGLAVGALSGTALAWALGWHPLATWLGAAVAVALLAVVGDLFESAIKRATGVKDSGALLPGHGGVLDRIDSILATSPAFALWALAVVV